jgi:hypothetical protein
LQPDGFQVAHDIELARFYSNNDGGSGAELLNPGPVDFFEVARPYFAGAKISPTRPEEESSSSTK